MLYWLLGLIFLDIEQHLVIDFQSGKWLYEDPFMLMMSRDICVRLELQIILPFE